MFRAIINSTPLTSDVANDFFQNIRGDAFSGDISFIATLRALVAPRMQEGESLYLRLTSSNYSANQIASSSATRTVRSICDLDYMDNGTVLIHNFCGRTQDDNYANLELMKSTFCQVYQDWVRLDKVTDFFRKTFYVLCFVNSITKRVVIFTDNMDIRKFHYLQCSIFAFMPWYFDPEKGVSPEEMELIRSLREKTPEKYEDCMAKIAEHYDFKTAKIRKLLAGFETRYERIECENIKYQINECLESIDGLNERIAGYLRSKRDYEIRLLGLETKIASGNGESEIMEYFLSNDKLYLISVDEYTMTFAVKDYLTFFDEELAMTTIENRSSYIYRPNGRGCNNYIPADDMEMFMTAVVEQKVKIKFCAAYQFKFGESVRAIAHHNYGSEFRDCTPNPHIDQYRCMGNYERTINTLIRDNNYIMALEQSVASCKSLNFGDPPVMKEFMNRLYGISDYDANIRCVELPDGKVVTPKEAIAFLKSEMTENE
ncbi:MAG: hypothetical protein K2F81_05845 [Ruminococcus sp.]|nr:hypothetical protein [Ruminococcus sp.]